MKSKLMPAWARTTSLDLAAAVSVLGITVGIDQSEDRLSGRGWKTFLLGLESVPHAQLGIETHKDDPLPSHKTKAVVGLLRKGKLQEADPHHPTLDVLRACAAREALMDWIRTGTRYRLAKVTGAERYQLVKGQEVASIQNAKPGFGTRDIKLAASLCILGCPLVCIEGGAGASLFKFLTAGYGVTAPIPSDLAQAYRTQRLIEMEPEHPLLWAMQGLSNRDAIADHARKNGKLILIRAPGTGRASLVSENATGRTMDRVKKHLRIV